MAKFVKVIRNNWKKSVVGSCALVYGINYAHDRYKLVTITLSVFYSRLARVGNFTNYFRLKI